MFLHVPTCIYLTLKGIKIINAVLSMRVVQLQKSVPHSNDYREDFLEPVVPWLIPQRQICVFHKVEVPGDLLKPLPGDAGCNKGVVEFVIIGPVSLISGS